MVTKLKGFAQVEPKELERNVFAAIGDDWMEICAGDGATKKANAMTASWGGMGIMWGQPVAFIVVRGQEDRATRKILDEQPLFSLCFLGEEHAEAKGYLGRVHGWDDPTKIESAGLHTGWCGTELEYDAERRGDHAHTPFIEESQTVLICEKMCAAELTQDCILDPAVWEKWYSDITPHTLFVAKIHAAFVK